MPDAPNIATRLAALLAHMPREALALQLGVTVGTLYHWQRGTRQPSRTALLLLERIEQEWPNNRHHERVE